ncbi:hypothetical protein EW145_g615 [Phellinidium pouzarii]|uniref:VTT domain-containing protein n=1 Tax=Phellinidium pouzarii TaxID=167371 RepID=A0A4S4LN75_9AGAM|nr:hypothetical protein EW145_g615 [Phellinidium pouzarii]
MSPTDSAPFSTLLAPPPRPSRARASSTGVRQPLSIATLETRCFASSCSVPLPVVDNSLSPSDSESCASSLDSSSSQNSPAFVLPPLSQSRTSPQNSPNQSMFPLFVSRTVDLWHVFRFGATGKHTNAFFESPDPSPRSSTDTDYILPLSATPQKTSFDSRELAPPPHVRTHLNLLMFSSEHASLLLVIILFPLSTALTVFCLSTLPISFAWPRTLSDLAQLGRDLNTYSQSGFMQTVHILGVLSVSAVWKHAWSIPGSVFWNVMAGALFHPLLATLFMTLLTTVGSIFSTLLAAPLAPVLTRFFPRTVDFTRVALEGSSSSSSLTSPPLLERKPSNITASSSDVRSGTPPWVRLSVLRLVGVVPWSALNVACGLTGVALRDCIAGSFIGCLPWTAVTCQIGDILRTFGLTSAVSGTDGLEGLGEGLSKSATLSNVLAQPHILLELIFLSVLSLAPILGREHLRRFLSSSENSEDIEVVKETIVLSCNKEESRRLADVDDLGFNKCGRRGRRDGRQRWTWKRLSMSVPRWSPLNSPARHTFFKDDPDARQ